MVGLRGTLRAALGPQRGIWETGVAKPYGRTRQGIAAALPGRGARRLPAHTGYPVPENEVYRRSVSLTGPRPVRQRPGRTRPSGGREETRGPRPAETSPYKANSRVVLRSRSRLPARSAAPPVVITVSDRRSRRVSGPMGRPGPRLVPRDNDHQRKQ